MTQPIPNLSIVPDYAAVSRAAAEIVGETVQSKPEAVLALPTGNTPLGLFAELTERARSGSLDLSRVHLFGLDEYSGLAPDHPNSLTGSLSRSIVEPAGFDPRRLHAVRTTDPDPAAAAIRYEAELAALGGLDLAVLGLGPNGHVAYNEPGSPAASRTRTLALTPESRAQAAAAWHGDGAVPETAITIGIGTLLEARRLLLIVSGEQKAEMLRRTLREPMAADVPASWLRLASDRLTIVADEAAASLLG
jgi:glucosamine-6-phosphate deaminase